MAGNHACVWPNVADRPTLPGSIGSPQLADTRGMPVRNQLYVGTIWSARNLQSR